MYRVRETNFAQNVPDRICKLIRRVKMIFRMNILLMLSAIIPYLDCCSSFKLFNRKSIQLYPYPSGGGIELSIHKVLKFQHGHRSYHNFLQPKSPRPPGHEDGHDVVGKDGSELEDDKPSFWHRYFQFLGFGKRTNHPDQELSMKLNRSVQNHDHKPGYVSSLPSSSTSNSLPTTTITPTTDRQLFTEKRQQDQDDFQFKLITEIVTLECVDILKWEFCLNGGRCFLYPILNHTLSSCECAEGFVGERCEAKSYEFIPRIRPRISLAKTNGGPLVCGLAVVDVLFLLFLFCKNYLRD